MITAGIDIIIISVLILIVGLIKPKWLLFWVENPGRMPIIMIASVLFMIGMTLFGEGSKRKREASTQQSAQQSEQKPAQKVDVVPAQELLKQ